MASDPDGLQWLEYELGVADGAGLPFELLVENDGTADLIDRLDRNYKTARGIQYHLFDADNVTEVLARTIDSMDKVIRRRSEFVLSTEGRE